MDSTKLGVICFFHCGPATATLESVMGEDALRFLKLRPPWRSFTRLKLRREQGLLSTESYEQSLQNNTSWQKPEPILNFFIRRYMTHVLARRANDLVPMVWKILQLVESSLSIIVNEQKPAWKIIQCVFAIQLQANLLFCVEMTAMEEDSSKNP